MYGNPQIGLDPLTVQLHLGPNKQGHQLAYSASQRMKLERQKIKLSVFAATALFCCAATAAEPVEVANNTEVRVMIDPAKMQVEQESDSRDVIVVFHYKEPVKTDNGTTYDRLEVLYMLFCDERMFTSYKLVAYDGERAVMGWTGATKADYAVPRPLSLDDAVVNAACAMRPARLN